MKEDSGTVDAPIGRHPTDRKKMCVTQRGGRNAVTHWEVVRRYKGYTHIRCKLETGRNHQIRVHMEYIGHPLFNDERYGGYTWPTLATPFWGTRFTAAKSRSLGRAVSASTPGRCASSTPGTDIR